MVNWFLIKVSSQLNGQIIFFSTNYTGTIGHSFKNKQTKKEPQPINHTIFKN